MNTAWKSLDILGQSLGDIGEGVTSYLKNRREEAERQQNYEQLKSMQGPGGPLEKFDPNMLGAMFPASGYNAGTTVQNAMKYNEAVAPKFTTFGDKQSGINLLEHPSAALGGSSAPKVGAQLVPPRPDKQYGWRDQMVNGSPATEDIGGMTRYKEEEFVRDADSVDPGVATGNVRNKPVGGLGYAPDLSPEDADFMARMALVRGEPLRMGGGMKGAMMFRDQVRAMAKIAGGAGMSPEEVATNGAAYAALKTTLAKLQTQATGTANNMKTTKDNLGAMLKARAALGSTPVPAVNRFVNWFRQELTGDPTLSAFETYIYTAAREYAKATGGGALSNQQLTDSATKEADKLLNAAKTPGGLEAAANAMIVDMENVQKEYGATLKETTAAIQALGARGRPGGGGTPAPEQGGTPKKRRKYDPATGTFTDVAP
jgi:hypothetical protein